MVRTALSRLHIKYRELEPFFNPFHFGFRENEAGAIQWLDVCILLPNKHMAVLLFNIRYGQSGVKPHERRAEKAKHAYLNYKKIPYIVLPRTHTSQEYQAVISRFIRKER